VQFVNDRGNPGDMPAALHEHLPGVKGLDAPAKLQPSIATRLNDDTPGRRMIQCAEKSGDLTFQFTAVFLSLS
jgi:hypothetical protein